MYVKIITDKKLRNFADIHNCLYYSQISQNSKSLHYLEKLLIKLLHSQEAEIRNQAAVYLNIIYGEVDWELSEAFAPKVVPSGTYYYIKETVISEDPLDNVIIILNSPSYIPNYSFSVLSWHSVIPQLGNEPNEYIIEKTFDKFRRCGFYDWRIITMNKAGVMKISKTALNEYAQGRFIVQPSDIADQQVHEINYRDANSATFSKNLEQFAQEGVTSIYINVRNDNEVSDELVSGFIKKARKTNLKVFVNYFNISVSEEKKHETGKQLYTCYMNNNKDEVKWINEKHEDALDYTKPKVWNFLIEEIISFIRKFNIDGIYLNNNQFWNHLMKLINRTQYRYIEGINPYTNKEYNDLLERKSYSNPILIKICKRIWNAFPHCYLITKCKSTCESTFARSGIILHLITAPAIYQHKTNVFNSSQIIKAFKDWFEQNRKRFPFGTYLFQPLSLFNFPYSPTFLYKTILVKLHMLFLLTNVPVTSFYPDMEDAIRANINVDLITEKFANILGSNLPKPRRNSNDNTMNEEEMVTATNVLHKQILEEFIIEQKNTFNLTDINVYCEKLRRLRYEKTVLRHGDLIILEVEESSSDAQIFAFARFSYYETAIIAINFSETESSFSIDFSKLMGHFMKYYDVHAIVSISNWLKKEPKSYCFLIEHINERKIHSLSAFETMCYGIQICKNNPDVYLNCLEHSLLQLNNCLLKGTDCGFVQPCQELLFAVKNKQPLNEFAMILANLYKNYLFPFNLDIRTLANNLNSIKIDSELGAKLFAYCKKLATSNEHNMLLGMQSAVKASTELLVASSIGPIVFITPELGRWSAVGGLGIMVDELTQRLATLGEEVHVITPYYHTNRINEARCLERDLVKFSSNRTIHVKVGEKEYMIEVFKGKLNNVKLAFLYNSDLFPCIYSEGDATYILKQIVAFAKASLEYLSSEHCVPSIIVTNDWYAGLVAAYKTHIFRSTTFLHICHNLQESYEGRLYPSSSKNTLNHIHQLSPHLLIDFSWDKLIINPSRCAILCSDQWATVSHSYKEELLTNSPLAPILKKHDKPFAFPNGIPVAVRLERLRKEAGVDHESAKKKLQMKYFKYNDLSIPVLSFIGRIVSQKGVHLICDVAEQLIEEHKGRINILVGGTALRKESYSSECADKLEYLTTNYPNSFWASPNEFCTDGPLINLGSDFGIMPSVFEPGGIVQHEFFLAGTPVIAFKTGGLKDAIVDFNWDTNEGNGFLFESHNKEAFTNAINKALKTFLKKEKYSILRKNAERSVMDGNVVAKEWCKEFYRLRGSVYVDKKLMQKEYEKINTEWDYTVYNDDYVDEYICSEVLGIDSHEEATKYIPISEFTSKWVRRNLIMVTFKISLGMKKAYSVQLAGSFNNWKPLHRLNYDKSSNTWSVKLYLKKGKYLYKYVVDGVWIHSKIDSTVKDEDGNINNCVILE